MRGRGGVFLGAGLGVGGVVLLGVAAARLFNEFWIIVYWVVVMVVSCLSVELLLVECDVRASNWLSSCSMSNCMSPLRSWELGVPVKMTWYCCAKSTVTKVSGWPVAAMDLRSSAAWRGLN